MRNKKENDQILTTNNDRILLLAGDYSTDPVLLLEKKTIDSEPSLGVLTVPEVAELLKISVGSVRRMQQKRRIRYYKIGGSVRFQMNDVLELLQSGRVNSIDK